MRMTTILVMMLLPALVFSQSFIGKTRQDIMKEQTGGAAHGFSFSEKGNNLERHEVNENERSWVLTLGFDSTGKCILEKNSTRCGDCQQTLLASVLRKKKYKWKSINNNQYLSKFSAGLLLEVQYYSETYFITFLPSGIDLPTYQSLTKRKR